MRIVFVLLLLFSCTQEEDMKLFVSGLNANTSITPPQLAEEFNILVIGHSQALAKNTDTDEPVYSDLVPSVSMPSAKWFDRLNGNIWREYRGAPYMNTTLSSPNTLGYGVEYRLAQLLLTNISKKVNLVKYAVGGTSFSLPPKNWYYTDPDGIIRNDGPIIGQLKLITDAANIYFHAVIFIFGENDALNQSDADSFEDQLRIFIAREKLYMNFDQFMIVETPSIYPDYTLTPYISTIQAAQLSVTQDTEKTLFVPKLSPLNGMLQTDKIHYNPAGIDQVARNIFQVIQNNLESFNLSYI